MSVSVYVCECDVLLSISALQKKNPGQDPDKKAAKVDMSPLFLERQPPMANRVAVSTQCLFVL